MAAGVEAVDILPGQAAAEDPAETPEVAPGLEVVEAQAALVDTADRVDQEAPVALEGLAEAARAAAHGRTMAEDVEEAMVFLLLVEVLRHQGVTQAEGVMVRPASGLRGPIVAGPIPRCWRSSGRLRTRRKSSSRTT